MRTLPALMAALVLAPLAFLAVGACNAVPDLPPLGTDSSAEELARHAARYCNRLEDCAPGRGGPVCTARMSSKSDTAEDRRGAAMMWNAFADCMSMGCVEMAACFSTKTIKMAADQAAQAGPPPARSPSSSAPRGP